jgi:hypothetical protein
MANKSSIESNAPQKATQRILAQSNEERSKFIIDVFSHYFGDGIKSNPVAFHGRFRKMAATSFNFYRGSALLFYQDLKVDQDPWIHGHQAAATVFIHVNIYTYFIIKLR